MPELRIPPELIAAAASQMQPQQPPSSKDEAQLARWLALVGSNLFDAGSTIHALNRPGTKEANPVLRGVAGNPLALLAIKGGLGVGESLLMDLLAKRGKTKAANVTAAGITGLNTALGINNLTKGRE